MNNGYVVSILSQINGVPTGNNQTAPLGAVCEISNRGLGITPSITMLDLKVREFAMRFVYCQFSAAVASAGRCCHMIGDATYGYGCATSTWAAIQAYNNIGISISAIAAAGDWGWVQCGGLNGWAVTAAVAAVAIGDTLYPTATNVLTVATTDAQRIQGVGKSQVVDADGGALGVGQVLIAPNALYL